MTEIDSRRELAERLVRATSKRRGRPVPPFPRPSNEGDSSKPVEPFEPDVKEAAIKAALGAVSVAKELAVEPARDEGFSTWSETRTRLLGGLRHDQAYEALWATTGFSRDIDEYITLARHSFQLARASDMPIWSWTDPRWPDLVYRVDGQLWADLVLRKHQTERPWWKPFHRASHTVQPLFVVHIVKRNGEQEEIANAIIDVRDNKYILQVNDGNQPLF